MSLADNITTVLGFQSRPVMSVFLFLQLAHTYCTSKRIFLFQYLQMYMGSIIVGSTDIFLAKRKVYFVGDMHFLYL